MAFKEVVTGPTKFVNLNEVAADSIIATGIFVGTKEGKFGKQFIIREEDGSNLVLYKKGNLEYLISTAGLAGGELIRVTYLGKQAMESGQWEGTMAHRFKLEVDSGNAA